MSSNPQQPILYGQQSGDVPASNLDNSFTLAAVRPMIRVCDPPYNAATTNTSAANTVAFNQALAAAALVGATVYWDQPMQVGVVTVPQNASIKGGGPNAILTPTETGGGSIFSWPVNSQNFTIEDVWITGNPTSPVNCGGIRLGTDTNNTCQRWTIRNCRIVGVHTGWNINGYVGWTEGLYAAYCTVGLVGTQLNAVTLDMKFENCAQPFAITDSNALTFPQLLIEGVNAQTSSATFDNCGGITSLATYLEQDISTPITVPHIAIGKTTQCEQVVIGGSYAGYAGISANLGVPLIDVDKCDGINVSGFTNLGTPVGGAGAGNVIRTSANTLNYVNNVWSTSGPSGPFTTDGSNSLSAQALNSFPNPNFGLWLRGWYRVSSSGCVASKETTIVRRGANALRVTATASATQPFTAFQITGDAVTALRGKNIRLCAWVWIPAISEYYNPARTARPVVSFFCTNGSGNVFSSTIHNRDTVGSWCLMHTTGMPQSDCTSISILVNPSDNTVPCTGNEYVIVDSMFLVESSVPLNTIINGCLVDSEDIMARGLGGRMEMATAGFAADAGQIYVVGDRVWDTAPTAGGFAGSICTTPGAGGTAVFKTFGAVSA